MAALLDGTAWQTFEGPGPQRGIGIVAPYDLALDRELYRWTPDDVSLHITRTHYLEVPVSLEMAEMVSDEASIQQAVRDLMAVESLAVAYACTSGSFARGVLGERALRAAMCAGGAPEAVTASGAMLDALRTLGVRNVAVATPYVDVMTERLCTFLTDAGHEVVGHSSLRLTGGIWKVSYSQVAELVQAADRDDADAIFVSCTNLPSYDLIAPLERVLGKPVLTANQVTMWSVLQTIGAEPIGPGQRLLAGPASGSLNY